MIQFCLIHARQLPSSQPYRKYLFVRITSAYFESACHWKRSLHSQRHHVLPIYPRPHSFRRWKVPGCSPWCHKSSLEQKTTMHLYITRKVEAGAPLFLLNKAYFGEGKKFFQCITQPPTSKLTEMRVDPHLVARIISHLTGRGTTNKTGDLLSSGTVACSTRAPQ